MASVSAGIDLGTTNSCLAVMQGDRPVIVPNELGEPVTPSLVSVFPNEVLIGKKARAKLLSHPANTFASIKRRMGERYSRTILGTDYSPEAVSALILGHLKQYGEKHIGGPIDDVVITVPANFNSIQRQATKDAGEVAGFNVLRVLNEPTAAALAYGHEHQLSSILVVFDLGGGTFDISVVEASDGLYEVLYSIGDNHLGGDDFNLRIVDWIVRGFEEQTGLNVRREVPAMCLIHEWAVAAKHTLTRAVEVRVKIDNLYQGKSFNSTLTRSAYEEMCRDLFNRVRGLAWNVTEELQKSRYTDPHPGVFENRLEGCDILLVGGETRVPAVRQLVQAMFRGRVRTDINPDEAVAAGAALQAGIVHRNKAVERVVLIDTTALSLGTAVQGVVFSRIIDANTRIPCTRTNEYVPGADYQRAVSIGVYQGESELTTNNLKLAEIELVLDPPRPRDMAIVLVTFHLDANDILHVTATDKTTGASQAIVVKDSQNLDRATVERLRREARQAKPGEQAEVERVFVRRRWSEWLARIEKRLDELDATSDHDEHIQTAKAFAQQLRLALNANDHDLASIAVRDLRAALQDYPPFAEDAEPSESADDQLKRSEPPATWPTGGGACGNCGAAMPPGYAFCGKCGVPLKKDCCAACGAALLEGFRFCGRCGAKSE